MGMLSKKLPIIAGAAVAIVATAASSIIYFTTSYSSMTMTMLEIMEEEGTTEATEDSEIDPDDPDEPPPIDIPDPKTGIDLDLYIKLLSLNWENIPDDLGVTGVNWNPAPFSSEGWNTKAYLYAYMLAMEICLRDEINPPDSDIVILPETLLGKWLAEDSSVCIPSKTYCTWDDRDQNTTECIGPFGMSGQWYTLELTGTAHGCIYISRLENPLLEDDKRAVVGTPYALRTTGGKYITEDILTTEYSKLEDCSVDTLKSSIHVGQLASSNTRIKYDRPAVTYLPDAMYMTALAVRLGIEGKTLDHIEVGGCSMSYLADIKSLQQYAPKGKTRVLSDCLVAASYNQFAGSDFIRGWQKADSYSTSCDGIFYIMCRDLIQSNISPIVTVDIANKNDTSVKIGSSRISAGSGNFARYVMTGCDDGTTIPDFVTEMKSISDGIAWPKTATQSVNWDTLGIELQKKYKDNYSTSKSLFLRAYLAGSTNTSLDTQTKTYVDVLYSGYSEALHTLVPDNYSLNGWQGYPTTGFSVINAGGIFEIICPDQVNYTFQLYGNKTVYNDLRKQYNLIGVYVTGLECQGENCLHAYTGNPIICTSPGDVNGNMYKQECISIDTAVDILNGNSPLVSYTIGEKSASEAGYNHKFSNIQHPLLVECTYPGSYKNHKGIDLGIGVGTPVHAVDVGVVVSVFSYPYVVSGLVNGNLDFSSMYWPAMGGYGNSIVTLHQDKNGNYYFAMYAHLDHYAHIEVGSRVGPDTILGYSGNTGQSTGPHLHIELRPMTSSYLTSYRSTYYQSGQMPSEFTSNTYLRYALEGKYD